jgi:carboxylesterase type B
MLLRFVSSPQCHVLQAKSFQHGTICRFSPSNIAGPGHSEDCLFLDIYAPTANRGNHPVYVFVQGGGLNTLSNANMNGEKLIAGGDYDMIVITFNYRVGPYGFLASKEVKANGDLNTGLLDQRKLLQWVKKYIKEVS